MSNFDYLAQRVQALASRQRHRRLVAREQDGVYLIDSSGRRLLNFGGNDYLGLAAERKGSPTASGSGASSLVCGWSPRHQQLADRIARFEGTESAVVFPAGFSACCGTIATLAEQGDLILSDQLNHASLIDGCRLSRAARIVFPHRDVDTVRAILEREREKYQRVWIVTDGVFSMDGDIAPLRSLCDLADQFNAYVVVDEAHGTGVLGVHGRGACEALGVQDRVPIRIGTMSKALGAQGGFVAGPAVVIDFLINHCRPLIFSTSLSPPAVEAALDGFDVIDRDRVRRRHVQHLSRVFRNELSLNVGEPEACVPIIPIIIGSDRRAVNAADTLADQGFYVPAIRPPTVPDETSRLRVSLTAAHDRAMVISLAKAIRELL